MRPDLDRWIPEPTLRVVHARSAAVSPDRLWTAACALPLADTGLLGRLIRWRIPGLAGELSFEAMFRQPPFMVLEEGERALVSGLVGRIWTLRRDYPRLGSAREFTAWATVGTAKVAFGLWAEGPARGAATGARTAGVLGAEARVLGVGGQGRLGVAAVRPLVITFGGLVGSEGLAAAVRRAELES